MDGSDKCFTFDTIERSDPSRRPCPGVWKQAIAALLFWSIFAIAAAPRTAQAQAPSPDLSLLEISGVTLPIQVPSQADTQIVRPDARVIPANRPRATAALSRRSSALETRPSSTPVSVSPQLNDAVESETSLAKPIDVDQILKTRGSVTFRKTPLSEVVFLLSDLWHINIVAGQNVEGEVSGAFHDAPLHEVLTAVLTSSGYNYRKTGSSLIVLTSEQVGTDDPNFVSETLALPEAFRGDTTALQAAQLLLSERGQLQMIGMDNVLIIDSEDRIARVRALFTRFSPESQALTGTDNGSTGPYGSQTLPTPTGSAVRANSSNASSQIGIAYFSPQFVEASTMAEPLQAALGDQVIVAVFPEENRIMVKGSQSDLEIANEAIDQLDRARPQVRITALIYDVGLQEIERLGVNWSAQPRSSGTALSDITDPESLRFRNLFSATTNLITDTAAPGAGNLSLSTINDTFALDALIQALDSSSEAKLLADPSITVGDRREASIRIVQKIPILAADPVDNSGVVFSQVQFEEAGVILNVQPRISRDGTIDMRVQPEFSVVTNFIANNPVIDSRIAETTVRVADGQTFAMGGLRQKSVVETVRGVPGLKDMKYVGKLFRSHDTEVRESELIVFIKPEVITPYDVGSPREQKAARVVEQQLDLIPHAQGCSLIPDCGNPNCPNHYPPPPINGGSAGLRFEEFGASYNVISDEVISGGLPPGSSESLPSISISPSDATAGESVENPTEEGDYYAPVRVEAHGVPSSMTPIPLEAPTS